MVFMLKHPGSGDAGCYIKKGEKDQLSYCAGGSKTPSIT
jgi:hypothetical protein